MTWLKLHRNFIARLDLTSESPDAVPLQTLNPSTADEPQHPPSQGILVYLMPESYQHWLLATSSPAVPQMKKNHVTLLHVLTPFCHSCLHAGEICFWLGEENLQAANPEMVQFGAGAGIGPDFFGEGWELFSGENHCLRCLCTKKGHLLFYDSFLKSIW